MSLVPCATLPENRSEERGEDDDGTHGTLKLSRETFRSREFQRAAAVRDADERVFAVELVFTVQDAHDFERLRQHVRSLLQNSVLLSTAGGTA